MGAVEGKAEKDIDREEFRQVIKRMKDGKIARRDSIENMGI